MVELIVGATGFLGRHYCRLLQRRMPQHRWIPMGRSSELGIPGAPPVQRLDLAGSIAGWRPPVEAYRITWLAANLGRGRHNPAALEAVNVEGPRQFLERLDPMQVSGMLLASTSEVYGTTPGPLASSTPPAPSTPYAESKLAQEAVFGEWCARHGVPLGIVRFFPLFGPGMPEFLFLAQAWEAARTGQDLPMTPGEQVCEFMTVDNAADALLYAWGLLRKNPVFWTPSTGWRQTLLATAEQLCAYWDKGGRPLPGAIPYPENVKMAHYGGQAESQAFGWQPPLSWEEALADWRQAQPTP